MEDLAKNFISLAEATKFCRHSQPYLNLRIRQGKLNAVKFGRNWMTTKEWLDEYLTKTESRKKNYISLAEATKYCSYSQPYLNLRVRQGKLQAVKLGRNWMTTVEWVNDYLKKIREYEKENGKVLTKHEEPKIENEIFSETKIVNYLEPAVADVARIRSPFFLQRMVVALAVVAIVSMSATFFFVASQNLIPAVPVEKVAAQVFESVEKSFATYYNWLSDKTVKIAESIFKWPKNLVNGPPKTSQGLVVVPSSKDDESLKKKIQSSFSDEVKVEKVDDSSGYITPVFKDTEGDKYLYLMVPVDGK